MIGGLEIMKTKAKKKTIKNFQQYENTYFPASTKEIKEPEKNNYGSRLAKQSLDIIRKKVKTV